MKTNADLSPLDRAVGTWTVTKDGRTMQGEGMMKKEGAEWEPDLRLAYERAT